MPAMSRRPMLPNGSAEQWPNLRWRGWRGGRQAKRLPRAAAGNSADARRGRPDVFGGTGITPRDVDGCDRRRSADIQADAVPVLRLKGRVVRRVPERRLNRFIEAVRADIDLQQSPHDLLRSHLSVLRYIDANRASWIVLYAQAPQFAGHLPTRSARGPRESSTSWRDYWKPAPGIPEPDTDFHMMSVALVVLSCRRSGRRWRHRRRRSSRADDQPVLARLKGAPGDHVAAQVRDESALRSRFPCDT